MYRITLKRLGVIFLCLQDCQLGLSASLRFADFLKFGRTQTLSQLLRSRLGFLLLICLQKQAFDTASKQKTPSLS